MLTEQPTQLTGQPAFNEPWQAEALAMVELLIQAGQLDANEWSQTLGEHLKFWQAQKADTLTNYYNAVLAALAQLVDQTALLSNAQITQREAQWRSAYLSTVHGQPVRLLEDSSRCAK